MEAMREIHGERHKRSYGSPRMQRELMAQGHRVSENTVARLMSQSGLRATTARKFRHTTDSNHRLPVAQNVLDRQFEASGPNEKWVSDITYVWTAEGWLYLAAVEDLYTRKVVGWSLGERLTSELVNEALRMGIGRQLPTVDLLVHSDRGSQYASGSYQRLLASRGIRCSMSRKGNCWDNAPMESFFATLKKELVHQERYATREEGGRACSSTSRCFTTGCGGIRRSATRVRRGSRKRLDAPSDLTHKGNPPAAESCHRLRQPSVATEGERPTTGSDEGNSSRGIAYGTTHHPRPPKLGKFILFQIGEERSPAS